GSYRAPKAPPGVPVLAVDVPSGLDALTGESPSGSVKAARTVTFGALKPGLLVGDGPGHCGAITLAPIGLPIDVAHASIHLVEDADVSTVVPPRPRDGHKWRSALAVVAGSTGMIGAASLVARAAMRAGAGMVRLGVPGAVANELPVSEAVAMSLSRESFDTDVAPELERVRALVVGPGLGRAVGTARCVRRLVAASGHLPTVVDADGLSALGTAEEACEVISARKGPAPVLLTPHDGEFAGLCGEPPGPDRIESARTAARRCGAIVLLKGSTTIVAGPEGEVLLSASGTPALATAGTGDVLSGIVGALCARGAGLAEAGAIGAHVHGRAARAGLGESLLAGDLPDLVAWVLSELCGG
ncbi:MAG: NAD(P)H-hydrate dehydratase, partial [Acidimicrobiales bacterium]